MEKRPLQKAAATRTKSTARNGCATKRNKKSSGINGGGPEIDRDKEFKLKKEQRRKACLRQAGRCYTSVCRK